MSLGGRTIVLIDVVRPDREAHAVALRPLDAGADLLLVGIEQSDRAIVKIRLAALECPHIG